MKALYIIIISIFFLGCNHPESKEYERHKHYPVESENELLIPLNKFDCKIIGITDGDTYKVLLNGTQKTIRLAHIDCPEKKQPYGNKAKQFASELCFGNIAVIRTDGKIDRYNRIIGEVFVGNICVNKELVKNGLAWHFKLYSNDKEYAKLEMDAKRNRINIWSESSPIPPWAWRSNTKTH